MRGIVIRATGLALALAALLAVRPALANARATAQQKCAAAKIKAAGKDAEAGARCVARSILNPDFDVDTCLDNAAEALYNAFDRAETKAEEDGGCVVTGDAFTVDSTVEDFSDNLEFDIPSE